MSKYWKRMSKRTVPIWCYRFPWSTLFRKLWGFWKWRAPSGFLLWIMNWTGCTVDGIFGQRDIVSARQVWMEGRSGNMKDGGLRKIKPWINSSCVRKKSFDPLRVTIQATPFRCVWLTSMHSNICARNQERFTDGIESAQTRRICRKNGFSP